MVIGTAVDDLRGLACSIRTALPSLQAHEALPVGYCGKAKDPSSSQKDPQLDYQRLLGAGVPPLRGRTAWLSCPWHEQQFGRLAMVQDIPPARIAPRRQAARILVMKR
jgi:hypothetical protein